MSAFDNYFGMYDGYVADNVDPLKLGRVKIMIPGLIEPASDWASPCGYPGSGANSRGMWCVPDVGSNVAVFFKEGQLENPRFFCGPWSMPEETPESPTFVRNMTPEEAVRMTGLQTPRWEIVLDDRPDKQGLIIRDRQHPDNTIVFDGSQQTLQISATVAVQIKSVGVVDIDALQIRLNGRIVLPTSKPI